jgi:hypothetical protein
LAGYVTLIAFDFSGDSITARGSGVDVVREAKRGREAGKIRDNNELKKGKVIPAVSEPVTRTHTHIHTHYSLSVLSYVSCLVLVSLSSQVKVLGPETTEQGIAAQKRS